jgi:CRP-like cAMP-binding protein
MVHIRDEPEIGNRFLLALPDACLKRLKPHLEYVEVKPRDVLIRTGAAIEHLYFFNRGFASLVKTMRDGRMVEVGAVGPTNAVGLLSLLGIERAVWESVVQGPGSVFRVARAAAAAEMQRSHVFADLVHKRAGLFLSELAQAAACNRLHSLEQRCCRWLLFAHDSAGTETFPLTHEFLALMLGVQRSGLSIVAGSLQRSGLIRYTRGRVSIVDRSGLEKEACECYGTSRAQLDHLLGRS